MPKIPTVFVERGQRFGRLVVIDPEARSKPTRNYPKGRRTPEVACDCGVTKRVAIYDIVGGKTASCGCLHDEVAEARVRDFNAARGFDRRDATKHREYSTWQNMVNRCTRSTTPNFHRYGGRGISVTPIWLADPWAFLDFLDNALGARPDGYSLDRIDNDGDYEPGNIRWASQAEQVRNREATIGDQCRHGHALTSENLTIDRGRRICRTCRNAAQRARYKAAKAA